MNSHVFMNGIGDDVYILDAQVDPNLVRVLPDLMNNLHQKSFQQPMMVPDVVLNGGLQYEYIPGRSWNPAMHQDGCQCPECRSRRTQDHVAVYQDLAYLQNADRKFVIDVHTYAFDTQSTTEQNQTMSLLRMFNSRKTPVLSKKFYIKLIYTMISIDENGGVLATQDGAIQHDADIHYYLTHDQDAAGLWTYAFMDIHGSDTITIPTMYGACQISLNLRGIEIYGHTNGYSLTMKDDGSLVYVNTGQKDLLLYKDMFGIEYRGYSYLVQPHDRVKVAFSTLFNNVGFVADITSMKDICDGLDYRTMDFDTVPSWNGIKLYTGTDITGPDFLPIANPQHVQRALIEMLDSISV